MEQEENTENNLEESIVKLFKAFSQSSQNDLSLAWNIGELLRKYLQHITDKKQGKSIINEIAEAISQRFSKCSAKQLYEYIDFASHFPDILLIDDMPDFIDWKYIKFLITIKDTNKRCYFLTLAIHYKWSFEKLKEKYKQPLQGKFRPCIDLHEGQVKQIVGKSLTGKSKNLQTNFTSEHNSAWYANLYRQDNLTGGHIIMLGDGNEKACIEALKAYPQGLQVGGSINNNNAKKYLEAGASHIIITSYIFHDAKLDIERLKQLVSEIGKDKIVIDLSCKKEDNKYFVYSERWQNKTDFQINKTNLTKLSKYCDEFLVHAIDIEGLCQGIDYDLVSLLADSPIPTTYAGGAKSIKDLEKVRELGKGEVDLTIGSALDIFGGQLNYKDVVTYNKSIQ